MLMVRRANMGLSIAAGGAKRKGPFPRGALNVIRHPEALGAKRRASKGDGPWPLILLGSQELAPQHDVSPTVPSFGNAAGAAASAARALVLSSSIWAISAGTLSNFNSSRMKPMKATSSAAP